jgi:Tol biopolymer transport system component
MIPVRPDRAALSCTPKSALGHPAARAVLVAGVAVVLLGAAWMRFHVVRVNGELAHDVRGLLSAQAITPDGSRVVYVADYRIAQTYELFVSPADGSGGALRISGELVPGGDVQSFVLAPDGSRAVYRADQDVDGLVELYCAPLDGGAPAVKLNGAVTSALTFLQFSPDATRVVFEAGNDVYSVPADASLAPVKLNAALVAGGLVADAWVSPDGARVVYRADQVTNEVYELFSVPIEGGAALKLNGPLVANGDVQSATLSPDGAWVVYTADQLTDGKNELFGVAIDGGPAVRLNGVPFAGATIQQLAVVDGPLVPRVVYRAEQDVLGRRELYVVPADGSQPPLVLNAPITGGSGVSTFAVTPDDAHAIHMLATGELCSAPLDASSAAVQLSAPLPSGVVVDGFSLAPAGDRVVYWTRDPGAPGNETDVYSVPADGSAAAVLLSGAFAGNRLSFSPAISPDGQRVVYLRTNGSLHDVYSAPIDGSLAPVRINGSLPYVPNGLYPQHFAFDAASTGCLFLTWQVADFDQLYRAPLDGSSEPAWISDSTGLVAEVTSFQLSADRSRALFAADLLVASANELHCADTDGASASVRVTDPLPTAPWQGDVTAYALTHDATRAVYLAPQDLYGLPEPYLAALDGSAPPRRLDGEPGISTSLLLTPDGQSALYLFDPASPNPLDQTTRFRLVPLDVAVAPTELPGTHWGVANVSIGPDGARAFHRSVDFYDDGYLFSLPLDGSEAAVQLDTKDVLADYVVSPDGSRVVYRRGPDIVSLGSIELRSVAADGSAAPLVLGGPLVADGDVTAFQLAPDGQRVVYRADQDLDERFEVFSASVEGTGPVVRLNAALVAGGDVAAFALAAGGATVVYRADQEVDARDELYAVPSDGSGPPVKLNPALLASGDVGGFALTADGARVVYVADQTANDVFELHAVPIDGSAPAVRISAPMATGGDVLSFQLAQDGSRAVYLADQRVNGVNELFSVPTEGGTAVRLSGELAAGGNVTTFVVSGDSQWVVFLADADVDGVNELFRRRSDGAGSAQRISGPLVEGGSVGGLTPAFRVSHDGQTVLFAADKRQDGRVELFAVTPYAFKYRAR